jgi:NADPH-dependent ferric siderophore reductase
MTEQRERRARQTRVLTVLRTEWLNRHMIRVAFGGLGTAGFADNGFTDHYVKLQFAPPGVEYPRPIDLDWVRENLPRHQWPIMRTYTIRSFDADSDELVIDFVYHGDEGVAGPWAAAAKPGDELAMFGPGGAYAPDPAADWHLLVGDESAIPAISAALECLPFDASAKVVIEVGAHEDEVKLSRPQAAEITWLHRADAMPGSTDLLYEHVRALTFPSGKLQVFAHGEGQIVMKKLRPHLFGERGLSPDQVSISGYWRQGRTEEEFREWKAQLRAEDEAAGDLA